MKIKESAMVFFRRFLYVLYYFKETDWKQLRKFLNYSSVLSGRSKPDIIADLMLSVFRYNISFKDYFCFRFYELDNHGRDQWAGTGYMYEFQLKMNPKKSRDLLENKSLFLKKFSSLIRRGYYTREEIRSDSSLAGKVLKSDPGFLVLKNSRGQAGAEVKIIEAKDFTPVRLIEYMTTMKLDLVEEYVKQHHSLMELSPSGLNTVRIITQISGKKVDFIGARLRISVNSTVDNMAAGNLAAPINLRTGIVDGPGVYSDITKKDQAMHPITGVSITGFAVPYWDAVMEMARAAALMTPENRSVGWDIAVTEEGTELIEGNHNWCKILWQLPVKRGLKADLERYQR